MAIPSHLALVPAIDAYRRQFEQLSNDGDAIVGPLADAQFTWHPAPEAWSVAECLEHLNVTARLYLPMLDEGIADAIRRGLYAEGPYRYNVVGRLMVWAVEPPPRFKQKTPLAFRPEPNRTRHSIMAAFRAYQVQFIDRLRQANGLDLARTYVSSPVARWLRIPLGSAFALMTAHERRHLWQARRVVENAAFPK